MKTIFVKDTFYKVLGSILTIFGFMLLVVGIGMVVDPDESLGVEIMIVSNVFIIPGLIILARGIIISREEKTIRDTAALVNTYRRITLEDISRKLGKSLHETQALLSQAVNFKLINGYMDRTTGEFVSSNAENAEMNVKFCPSCGAQLDRIYLKGETIKCGRCGMLFF